MTTTQNRCFFGADKNGQEAHHYPNVRHTHFNYILSYRPK